MRTVQIPGTDIETSCLGMGCASLGSRISRSQGVRALAAAFERGVTWYDIAPVYGAGEAEDIFAAFLAGRRDRLFLCSKVGLAPPSRNGAVKLAYGLGRPVIGLAQGLRRRFRSLSATRNQRAPLTPESIEASLNASLKRLGTDYLDVFALHDPDPAGLQRPEILSALQTAKASGKVRYLSVAGSFEAALQGAAAGPIFDFFQLADDPVLQPLPQLAQALGRPAGFITHSVLGVGGAKDALAARLKRDPALAKTLAASGYGGTPENAAARLLMRRAFASNSQGVVLASMFTGHHLEDNATLAALPVDPAALALVAKILAKKKKRA